MTTIISLFCQVNFVGRMLTTAITMAARTMGNVLTASDHSLAFVPRDSPAACARTKWTSACPALVTKAPPVWTGWTPSPACVPQVNTAIIILALSSYYWPGHSGSLCDQVLSMCHSSPCHNGATCVTRESNFKCICAQGYSGKLCLTSK